MTISVLIADDETLVRAGLRMILESQNDIEVCGESVDGDGVMDQVLHLQPDVVLIDIVMPNVNGLEATRRLFAREGCYPKVIILTTFHTDENVYEALRLGASGFLLKDSAPEDLIAAVRVVARGDALLAPAVTRRLIEQFALPRPAPRPTPGLARLTQRELAVLKLVGRGMSTIEVAESLFISQATAKSHIGHILTKLDLRDRVQAVVFAYEAGVVEPGCHD